MQLDPMLGWLSALHPIVPIVLAGLGALVVVGQAYVAITPSEKDDAWFEKLEGIPLVGSLIKALKSFSPIQRKKKKK